MKENDEKWSITYQLYQINVFNYFIDMMKLSVISLKILLVSLWQTKIPFAREEMIVRGKKQQLHEYIIYENLILLLWPRKIIHPSLGCSRNDEI